MYKKTIVYEDENGNLYRDRKAIEREQSRHKWKCISPGLSDSLYECEKCGKKFMEQVDNPERWDIPEFGCGT